MQGPPFNFQLVRTIEEFDDLAQPWQALEQQVEGVLPFQTFAWNRAWWDVFAVTGPTRRDQLRLSAFWVDGRLVGVLPLFQSVYGLGPLALFAYQRPFGADPNLTEIRTPLVLPAYREAVMAHWFTLIGRSSANCAMDLVFAPGALADQDEATRRAGLRCFQQRYVPNFVLDLPDSWDTFRAGLKRNIKESLRRCYNSLAREGLRHDLQVLDTPADILAQLPAFYQLHGSRAAQTDTVLHPDYFDNPAHRAFIDMLASDRHGSTSMRLFCLRIEGKPVAMRLGFEQPGSLYLYYSGYDLAFAKYSVMTTLVAESLRWAIQKGLKQVNLSIGEDVSKTRWSPREVAYSEYLAARAGMRGKMLAGLVEWLKK